VVVLWLRYGILYSVALSVAITFTCEPSCIPRGPLLIARSVIARFGCTRLWEAVEEIVVASTHQPQHHQRIDQLTVLIRYNKINRGTKFIPYFPRST